MKRCSKCGVEKELTEFYANRKSRALDGLQSRCKDCCKAVAEARRKADPAEARRLRTEWGKKNPDKQRALYRARDKRKLERDPEAYRAAAAERVARYRELHPDRIAEDSARNNAERIAKWRSLHPGREAELKGHRLMVERKRLPWADVPRMKDMYELARAYRSAGVSCQVDHIVPLKHPLVCGLHVIWNLQLLSRKDNSSKGNRTWPDMPDG